MQSSSAQPRTTPQASSSASPPPPPPENLNELDDIKIQYHPGFLYYQRLNALLVHCDNYLPKAGVPSRIGDLGFFVAEKDFLGTLRQSLEAFRETLSHFYRRMKREEKEDSATIQMSVVSEGDTTEQKLRKLEEAKRQLIEKHIRKRTLMESRMQQINAILMQIDQTTVTEARVNLYQNQEALETCQAEIERLEKKSAAACCHCLPCKSQDDIDLEAARQRLTDLTTQQSQIRQKVAAHFPLLKTLQNFQEQADPHNHPDQILTEHERLTEELRTLPDKIQQSANKYYQRLAFLELRIEQQFTERNTEDSIIAGYENVFYSDIRKENVPDYLHSFSCFQAFRQQVKDYLTERKRMDNPNITEIKKISDLDALSEDIDSAIKPLFNEFWSTDTSDAYLMQFLPAWENLAENEKQPLLNQNDPPKFLQQKLFGSFNARGKRLQELRENKRAYLPALPKEVNDQADALLRTLQP